MAIILEPVSFFGLDLGQTQARVIQLNHATDIPTLVAAGSIATGSEVMSDDTEPARRKIAEKIRQLLTEVGVITENVVFALPESEVFTRIIELPKMAKDELAQAIQFEAESYIPYAMDEVQLDWQILEEDNQNNIDRMHALLVAAPLKIIERLVNIIEMADLKPLAIESNCIACNRSFTRESSQSPCIAIVDIGSTSTELCISDRGIIRLTHNIPIGGKQITQAIAKELSIDDKEADKLKLGLSKLEDIQKELVTKAFTEPLDSISAEIKRSVDFFQGQPNSTQISKIVVCGQGSRLDGLVDVMKTVFTVPISYGNPWEHIQCHEALSAKQLQQMAPAFAVAVGLAMRKER